MRDRLCLPRSGFGLTDAPAGSAGSLCCKARHEGGTMNTWTMPHALTQGRICSLSLFPRGCSLTGAVGGIALVLPHRLGFVGGKIKPATGVKDTCYHFRCAHAVGSATGEEMGGIGCPDIAGLHGL
jgi:hypothetical protein